MKRIPVWLGVVLVVLTFVVVIISMPVIEPFINPAWGAVVDRSVATWTAVKEKYEGWAFERRATKVLNCINDQLQYSEALGFSRTSSVTVLVVMTVSPEPAIYLTRDSAARTVDIIRQVVIVLDCADAHGGRWRAISIQVVSTTEVSGFLPPDGEYTNLIALPLIWAFGMDRDIAKGLIAAEDKLAYVTKVIEERSASFIELSWFGGVAKPEYVRGKLVVEAAKEFIAFAEELNRLTQESK